MLEAELSSPIKWKHQQKRWRTNALAATREPSTVQGINHEDNHGYPHKRRKDAQVAKAPPTCLLTAIWSGLRIYGTVVCASNRITTACKTLQ